MGSARQQAGVDGPSHKNGRLIGNSTVGVGQGLSEEEESRNNETDDVPRGAASAVQQAEVENQQQQGPVIQWQQFLPVKTLKVLLVESDDSTRQVVSALLRNCIYEVIPVENGNHAWQYLEDIQNRIDLVLAEVFTPSLSGIGLLDRIMSHNICKNIPVIMMSSNDSMGTVFKCLSKGAVDFLVKPIRKNELKNLWQHVWRRCHSSSGSGSESGIRTQKCKSKSGDESGNNSGSSDDDNDDNDDDDVSVGLNARDGSDNGSGTQSSWTKCAVEIDSLQPMSPDQLADPTDSTCAQVIHPKSEICSNRWLPAANKRNFEKHKEIKDDFREKDLEIGVSRNPSAYYKYSPNEMSVNPADKRCESMPQNNCTKETMTENDGRNTLEEPTKQAADLIGSTAKNKDSQQAARTMDGPNCSSKIPEGKNKNHDGCIEIPSLELSLKRLRSDGGGATAIQDERNVLRRSDHSAFTRYHTSAASNQGGTGFGGSCSPHDNSSEAVKTDSTYNMKSNSGAAPIKQGSNGSSANNDMGSTNKNVVTKPTANKEKVTSPSAVKASTHTSAFHPMQHCTSPANVAGKEKAEEAITRAVKVGHTREVQSNVVQHHHHIHHYVHHVIPQQQPSIDHKLSHENIGSAAPLCGSSNVFDPLVEGHAANYSQNGSNSGSNNGSNVQNGSTIAVNAGRPNMEIANCVMDKSGAGGGNGSGSGSGNEMYQKQLAQREAALNKFRQKRKERNFGKKVRYQSRKWLAEQRPRFRGQFVRQSVQDEAGREAADR